MRLELDEQDLTDVTVPTSRVLFTHLKPHVQQAVVAVGRATFYRDRGAPTENYTAVYPPASTVAYPAAPEPPEPRHLLMNSGGFRTVCGARVAGQGGTDPATLDPALVTCPQCKLATSPC